MVHQGSLSVFWTSTSKGLETEYQPIRIPIYKGLLGYRIFLIRKEDQPKCSKVRTLADLKGLVAGQGQYWSDTEILRKAGLTVATSTNSSCKRWRAIRVGIVLSSYFIEGKTIERFRVVARLPKRSVIALKNDVIGNNIGAGNEEIPDTFACSFHSFC